MRFKVGDKVRITSPLKIITEKCSYLYGKVDNVITNSDKSIDVLIKFDNGETNLISSIFVELVND